MKKELQLLVNISENENLSQRQLAKAMNLSLGTINGLISSMHQMGYIVIEQVQTNRTKYFLSELGHHQKAKWQYQLIVDSYHIISKTKNAIRKVIEDQILKDIHMFYLYGEEDEIFKLTKMSLIELKREHSIKYEHLLDISLIDNTLPSCILYWDTNYIPQKDINTIMIL